MVDILKYHKVIQNVLAKLRIPKSQREDMAQECYVALIERNTHLEHGESLGKGENYAAMICLGKMRDLRIQEAQYKPNRDKVKPGIRFDSLSDPRIHHKASKVPIPDLRSERNVTTWELEDAMLKLPFEDYRVVYSIFVDEKTQETTAADLGLTVDQVRTRKDRGIARLRQIFGEE